jgi:MtrB/PioB family decaheme-associated outer membrane protein
MKNNRFAVLPMVAILSAVWSGNIYADSAVGVDTLLGNSLNPGGLDITRATDPEGFSPVMAGKGPSHTPGGQLYLYPTATPVMTETTSGWAYSGSLEAGVTGGGGNLNNAGFKEYSGFENGALINSFAFAVEKPESHAYVNARAGGVGRDDAYFGFEAGRYNQYKLSAFYNETPHVFATNAKPLWNGVGTGNLTLPAGIAPGSVNEATGANYAAFQNVVRSLGTTTIELERKKLGVKFEGYLTPNATGFVSYTNERREGTRSFGGGFLFDFMRNYGSSMSTPGGSSYVVGSNAGAPAGWPGGNNFAIGGVMETVEPLDYTTHDFLAGLRLVEGKDRLNLTVNASLFRNDIKSLTWQNPFQIGFPGGSFYAAGIDQGRFALPPDNDYYNVKAEYGRVQLPMDGQFTAVVSVGRMRQNDDLLPPTVNDNILNSFGGDTLVPTSANWASTDALSQKTANARIDTALGDFGLSVRPTEDLTLRAKLRYYDENNLTDYTAFNPLMGQYGYVALDGALSLFGNGYSGIYNPAGARQNNAIHYKSIPTSYHKINSTLAADYNLSRLTVASLALDREEIFRDHRERDRTTEDRIKVSMNTRAIEDGTLRLSYEYANRRGSEYNFDPYKEFYIVEPINYVHTLAQLRKFDLSDRSQHILNARFNYMLRQDMDVFVSLQHKQVDNRADYGRIGGERAETLNLEWNYSPSPVSSFYTFYSIQEATSRMRNINDAVVNASPDAGGASYPLSGAWEESFRDLNQVVGAGLSHLFGKFRLESRYSLSWMKNKIKSDYANAQGATIGSGRSETLTDAEAANSFSNMRFTQHLLETSVTWPLEKNLNVRLFHRYEKRNTADWHYDGISEQLIGQKLYLGNSAENFTNNMFGVFLQYSM